MYRKYRSKSLSEIIGQDHITHTLEQAIKQGKISHAYLLTGPKGVGKTSVARILAHEINNLPYDDDAGNIDIIEIDAASNRRIDEIRELREKVYMAPVSAKYKVYIIDEVHMLTKEAFNALLKTLEEPPEHVVFILATTDAHKLPETIISRTQRFSFKPVEKAKVVKHLAHIAKQEKVKVNQEALELLAEHGEGSFRDSISLLDQASDQDRALTADAVRNLLGIPPEQGINELITNLSAGSLSSMALSLAGLIDQGFQAAMIAKQLSARLRQQLLEGHSSLDPQTTLELLAKLIEVPAAHDPEKYLEIVMLQFSPVNATKVEEAVIVQEEPVTTKKFGPSQLNEALWSEVVTTLKQKHNTLYGVVRMARPEFNKNGTLTLVFAFDFHKKRISEAQNHEKLVGVIKEVSGKEVIIESIVDKNLKTEATVSVSVPKAVHNGEDSKNLQAISNIFGDAELLE